METHLKPHAPLVYVSFTAWWSRSCLLKLSAYHKSSNAAGQAGMLQTFAHRSASVSSVKCTFIWLCTTECMSMLFSLLLLSDEPNSNTRGVVRFCLRSLKPGLSASLHRGQTQVVMIKAELLTPIPKNETAYCVATDSSHNEAWSESCCCLMRCFSWPRQQQLVRVLLYGRLVTLWSPMVAPPPPPPYPPQSNYSQNFISMQMCLGRSSYWVASGFLTGRSVEKGRLNQPLLNSSTQCGATLSLALFFIFPKQCKAHLRFERIRLWQWL